MESGLFRLSLAQLNTTVGDLEGNKNKIIHIFKKSQSLGCHLIAFPELCLTGYPPEDLLLRPDFYQRCDKALELIQKQVTDMLVVLGVPVQSSAGIYNAAVVIHQNKIIRSKSAHPLFREDSSNKKFLTIDLDTSTYRHISIKRRMRNSISDYNLILIIFTEKVTCFKV